MKGFVKIILVAALLITTCATVWGEQPPMSHRQYKKNLTYNKNAFPAGWKYEAGYTVWRMQRKLPVNLNTYRKYRNDKAWHNRMRSHHRPEELLLNTVDWTIDELAFFIQQHQDLFKFHPAGYED